MRIAVLGLHNHYHAWPMTRALTEMPEVEVAGVFDEREGLAAGFAQEHGIALYPGRDSLLADDLDALLVMSDTVAHHRDVMAAIESGLSVLIDKPLALTGAQARELADAATRAGVVVSVAFHIRFAPAYREAKRLIQEGAIGTPLTMRISIRVPLAYVTDEPKSRTPGWYADPARSGGGGFLDHGVHYVDALRFLLDTEPASVQAEIDRLAHPALKVDDYGVAIIRTTAGQVVTVESTWHAPGWYAPQSSPEECHIVGTTGEIIVRYHGEPQLEWVGEDAAGRRSRTWTGPDRGAVAYRAIVEDFVAAVGGGHPLAGADAEDGWAATTTIDAAYRAARDGTRVVLEKKGTQ